MQLAHPMQAFTAGALAASVDRMRDIALIREIRKCSSTGFEIVFGSGAIVSVRLDTVEWGSDDRPLLVTTPSKERPHA